MSMRKSGMAPSVFSPEHIAPRDTRDAQALDFRFGYAYQPIVDLRDRSVYAHEALVRGPNGEPAPTVLSRVSVDNRRRFDQACRVKAIKGAAQLGIPQRLSINFLPRAIDDPQDFIRATRDAAHNHGFPIERLIFEATEGEVVSDGERLSHILRAFQRAGFLTAIDDFGSGYAGLTLLADFQPDFIKLDMELVRSVDASRARQAITRGILRMCADLGIRVIAEGIETAGERDFFLSEGVELMQGYLFSRPAFQACGAINPTSWPLR